MVSSSKNAHNVPERASFEVIHMHAAGDLNYTKEPLKAFRQVLGGTHATVPQKRPPCRKLSCSDGQIGV